MFLFYSFFLVRATPDDFVAPTNQTYDGPRILHATRYHYDNCFPGQVQGQVNYLRMGILVEESVFVIENRDRRQVKRKVDEIIAYANTVFGEQMDINLRIDKFLVAGYDDSDIPWFETKEWWWDVPNHRDNTCAGGKQNIGDYPRYAAFQMWVAEHFDGILGLWHLFTACKKTGSPQTLGLASVGALCTPNGYNVGWTVWEDLGQSKFTFTHEVGHNFGTHHLQTGEPGEYIMRPFYPGSDNLETAEFHRNVQDAICKHISVSMSITPAKRLNKKLYQNPDYVEREFLSKGITPHPSLLLHRYQHLNPSICWLHHDGRAYHADSSSDASPRAASPDPDPKPGNAPANADNKGFTPWGSWSACSETCGGTRVRIRDCVKSGGCLSRDGGRMEETCNADNCHAWACRATTKHSDCDVTCGNGQKTVTTTYIGKACGSPVIRWQECDLPKCAVGAAGLTCSEARVQCDVGTSRKNGDPVCGTKDDCDANGQNLCCEICTDRRATWPTATAYGFNCISLFNAASHFCQFETSDSARFRGVESQCCECGGGDRIPISTPPGPNKPGEPRNAQPRNPDQRPATPRHEPPGGQRLTCSEASVRCDVGISIKASDPVCGTKDECASNGQELCCEICTDRSATWPDAIKYGETCISLLKVVSYFCQFETSDPARFQGVKSDCCACGGGERSRISSLDQRPATLRREPLSGQRLTCSTADVQCGAGMYKKTGDPECGTKDECATNGQELCCEICTDRRPTWPEAIVLVGQTCSTVLKGGASLCSLEDYAEWEGIKSQCCACGGGNRQPTSDQRAGNLRPRDTTHLTCTEANVQCRVGTSRKNGDPVCGLQQECVTRGQEQCCDPDVVSLPSKSPRPPDHAKPSDEPSCDANNPECTTSDDGACEGADSCTREPPTSQTSSTKTWDKRWLWLLLPLSGALGLVVYMVSFKDAKIDSKEPNKTSTGNVGAADARKQGPLRPKDDATEHGAPCTVARMLPRAVSATRSFCDETHPTQETFPPPVGQKRSSGRAKVSKSTACQSRRGSAAEPTARHSHTNHRVDLTGRGSALGSTARRSDPNHRVDPTGRDSATVPTARRSEDNAQFSPPRTGTKERRSKPREMPPCSP